MCVITVKDYGVNLPEEKSLRNCYSKNRDGIGVAFKKKDKQFIFIKKDFKNFKTFYGWMKNNITPEDLLVIHFRFATHGLVDKGNRHPFPITRNIKLLRSLNLKTRYAVVHNGILDYRNHRKLSDTQKFIIDILSSEKIKNNLKNKTIQKLITSFIGEDKLAILSMEDGLILFGNYIKHSDGCLYSNKGYEDIPIRKYYEVKSEKSSDKVYWNNSGIKYIVEEDINKDNPYKAIGKFCELCFSYNKNVRYYADWSVVCCKECRNRYRDLKY